MCSYGPSRELTFLPLHGPINGSGNAPVGTQGDNTWNILNLPHCGVSAEGLNPAFVARDVLSHYL